MSEEREPIMSDADLIAMAEGCYEYTAAYLAGEKVRDFYEAKITSVELMAVKTVSGRKVRFGMLQCENCERTGWTALDNFCPGCGAKIIEP